MHTTLKVPEMSCDHCKTTVEGAVSSLAGVSEASVDLEAKTVHASFDEDAVGRDRLIEAIEEAGYSVAR